MEFRAGAPLSGDLSGLRAILEWLYGQYGFGDLPNSELAAFVDALLDAIYARVTGGRSRPKRPPTVYEPGIGTWPGNLGLYIPGRWVSQHRWWFQAREPLARIELYDKVAGLLLRDAGAEFVLEGLYLYPPRYPPTHAGPPTHVFMLLLGKRRRHQDEVLCEADPRLEEAGRKLCAQLVRALASLLGHRARIIPQRHTLAMTSANLNLVRSIYAAWARCQVKTESGSVWAEGVPDGSCGTPDARPIADQANDH